MYKKFINFVRNLYETNDFIPLHEPKFFNNEKKYLNKVIDSGFVSSIGNYVNEFEERISDFTGSCYAISTVNGTSALHASLLSIGVEKNTEVITQSLTFVATCNVIRYCNAIPIFIDVDLETLGLSPNSLEEFLENKCEIRKDGFCWNKSTNRKIVACLPMHTFGFSAKLDEISNICTLYNITLIEDAAESLGSYYKKKHTGTIGKIAAISFNGNKIISSGGGGMILTDDKKLSNYLKHITTTAKVIHDWEYKHDHVGFNYRMPNLNAALGLAQIEVLDKYLINKRLIAKKYHEWGSENDMSFLKEPDHCKSNYWLNTILLNNKEERNKMLEYTNRNNVTTRPIWTPIHKLNMYKKCQRTNLRNTEWLEDRIVNVPSSVNFNVQ